MDVVGNFARYRGANPGSSKLSLFSSALGSVVLAAIGVLILVETDSVFVAIFTFVIAAMGLAYVYLFIAAGRRAEGSEADTPR